MTKIINVSNIEIQINRKKIKNMYLKVSSQDGKVRISAPMRTKDEAIIKFVTRKLDWIEYQKRKYENSYAQNQNKYIDGEIHYVWGEPYVLKFNKGNRNQVQILENKLILTSKQENTSEQVEKILMEWYRKQLSESLPKMLDKWENIIGVKANKITIRSMKSRWGSCNTRDKRISINLQLVKKPLECLEYVVVHELVHLLEASHNQIFKRYMDQFMPNWRDIKKKLI